jgi:hypothetical protein
MHEMTVTSKTSGKTVEKETMKRLYASSKQDAQSLLDNVVNIKTSSLKDNL